MYMNVDRSCIRLVLGFVAKSGPGSRARNSKGGGGVIGFIGVQTHEGETM